jgi:hypothetical protein
MDLAEGGSVMIMGANYWMTHRKISEPRLAKKLAVDHFGAPERSQDDEGRGLGIPVRMFPFTRVCPQCHRLLKLPALKKDQRCPHCGGEEPPKTIPPRLVAACQNGHVEDFPWKRWSGCQCDHGKELLYLEGGLTAGGGSDLRIVCKKCRKERNFVGALEFLPYSCSGKRPWLGDRQECGLKLKGLLRGASNVYFPVIQSSLSIPPFSSHIHISIRDFLESAKENWKAGKLAEYIQSNVALNRLMEKENLKIDDLVKAFVESYAGVPAGGGDFSIKLGEWIRLTQIEDVPYHPGDDFRKENVKIDGTKLKDWFTLIARVTKLREVSALSGFSRVGPLEDTHLERMQAIALDNTEWSTLTLNNERLNPVPIQHSQTDWLPGVEMYGEGIFFQFDGKRLSSWEHGKATAERTRQIGSSPRLPLKRDGIDPKRARTILIHTFAHHLIREISFACGYSLAAIRERIYSENVDGHVMAGVLIYTATSDSEGTLGGLVAQAKDPIILHSHVAQMLNTAGTCSQDPLCSSHDPTLTHNAWGASCHSCSQLPETSCEGLQNKLLDRFSLMCEGTREGYFE